MYYPIKIFFQGDSCSSRKSCQSLVASTSLGTEGLAQVLAMKRSSDQSCRWQAGRQEAPRQSWSALWRQLGWSLPGLCQPCVWVSRWYSAVLVFPQIFYLFLTDTSVYSVTGRKRFVALSPDQIKKISRCSIVSFLRLTSLSFLTSGPPLKAFLRSWDQVLCLPATIFIKGFNTWSCFM